LIGGGIYRAERRGRGCPEARRLGGPSNVRRSYRARRPRGRAGRVLAVTTSNLIQIRSARYVFHRNPRTIVAIYIT
jgi:hypothetical protein